MPIGLPASFLAGLLSFASPCVLPLVPAYLSFLAGVSHEELVLGGAGVRRRLLDNAVSFCLGFSLVFVMLGASATIAGQFLDDHASLLAKISGAIIVLLGLQLLGVLRLPILARDSRFHPVFKKSSPLRSFAIGVAFAFGWTPCVGPVLAAILTMAANGGAVQRGVELLACYALGIALPFLGAALAFGAFEKAYSALKTRLHAIEIGAGVVLVVTGALILTGTISIVSGWLMSTFPFFAWWG